MTRLCSKLKACACRAELTELGISLDFLCNNYSKDPAGSSQDAKKACFLGLLNRFSGFA